MIEIRGEHILAEGLYQKCYKHPLNENVCIKISKLDIKTARLLYEIKYFKKISKKKLSFDFLEYDYTSI